MYSNSSSSSSVEESIEEYISPFMCLLKNLSYVIDNDGKKVLPCNTNSLVNIIRDVGFNTIVSCDAAYDDNNDFLGYAVIRFGLSKDVQSFIEAHKLEQAFYEEDHSMCWYDDDSPRT